MKFSWNRSAKLALLTTLVGTGSAVANDSTATLGGGGLELTISNDIVMESEDLFLSPREVRIRYGFRNESSQDVTTRVAFPLPEVPFGPMDNVQLPVAGKENFVDFSVMVDGQAVTPELEQRAISAPVDNDNAATQYPEGRDMTSVVRQTGLPLNANLPAWRSKLRDLPHDVRKRLVKEGVLFGEPGDGTADDLSPQWSLRETYHWQQTFPANKLSVVEHRYKPVVGSSFFTGDASDMQTIRSTYERPYCLDHAGIAGVQRLLEKAKTATARGKSGSNVFAVETKYILKTGANWKASIGQFTMTLDKLHEDAVLSTCFDGIKKTGATTFEVQRNQFEPKNDIQFVIFRMDE